MLHVNLRRSLSVTRPLKGVVAKTPFMAPAREAYRVVRGLARLERKKSGGSHHLRMLRRGFFSDKHWRYRDADIHPFLYLSDWAYETRCASLNPLFIREIFRDKEAFWKHLNNEGMDHSAPAHLGVLRGGRFERNVREIDSGRAILTKAIRGSGGAGILFFDDYRSFETAVKSDNIPDSVVQESIAGHEQISQIFPRSLNTMRILAFRGLDGEIVIPAAAQKFGTQSTGRVDNSAAGGLVAEIDVESGTLSPLVTFDKSGRKLLDQHPDTLVSVKGFEIPYWSRSKQLVIELMRVFPTALHVGWDIAITDSGPIVIEANAHPDPVLLQAYSPALLSNSDAVQFYWHRRVIGVRQYRWLISRQRQFLSIPKSTL